MRHILHAIGAATILVLATWSLPFNALAADSGATSPIGLWKTADDKTGKPRGIVRVYEDGGKYFAKIERGQDAAKDAGRRCTACTDERKELPIIGLIIVRNMQRSDEGYAGGDILGPDSGAVYKCSFRLEDGGSTLVVRGYMGVSLFGRSQKWLREAS